MVNEKNSSINENYVVSVWKKIPKCLKVTSIYMKKKCGVLHYLSWKLPNSHLLRKA